MYKRKRYTDYETNAIECNAQVISEPVIQTWQEGETFKNKTTFRMKSLSSNQEIDCVVWKNFNVNQWDLVHVIGRLQKEGRCFIAWQAKITKRAENNVKT